MASSIIKMFRFRKRKEDVERRGSVAGGTLRCCSPITTWRSDKEAIYISGASWTRPAGPYSVITAPKKGKQTRSCPGEVTLPPFKHSSISSKRNISHKSKSTAGFPSETVDQEVKTSEYGSAEPSPTDNSATVTTKTEVIGENEYLIQVQKYSFEVRKLRRRLKEERQYFKEQSAAFQREKDHLRRYVDKATRALTHAERNYENERRRNQLLRRELHQTDIIIANLQNQLKNRRYRCTERVNDICCPSCGSLVSGAGEALCALTQSNTNLYGDPSHSQAYESPRTPDEIKNYHIDYFKRLDKESPRSSTPFFDNENRRRKVIENIEKSFFVTSRCPLKRSYSDSELPSMLAAAIETDLSQEIISSILDLPTSGKLLSESLDRTSFSSDDDSSAVELLKKQLRHCGDVVRFIPPRRVVRQATYRRYGRKERSALAEFDYLQDLTTDASALATSSDYSSPENRFLIS